MVRWAMARPAQTSLGEPRRARAGEPVWTGMNRHGWTTHSTLIKTNYVMLLVWLVFWSHLTHERKRKGNFKISSQISLLFLQVKYVDCRIPSRYKRPQFLIFRLCVHISLFLRIKVISPDELNVYLHLAFCLSPSTTYSANPNTTTAGHAAIVIQFYF